MIIDCDVCDMQHTRTCDDCIVTALVRKDGSLELAENEKTAIDELSRVGLVAPIRLVEKSASHERVGR